METTPEERPRRVDPGGEIDRLNIVECPECKGRVIPAMSTELKELVLFDTTETTFLEANGIKVTTGYLPHDCKPVMIPRKFEGFEKKPGPMVLCVVCKNVTMPAIATFDGEVGWVCHKCKPV